MANQMGPNIYPLLHDLHFHERIDDRDVLVVQETFDVLESKGRGEGEGGREGRWVSLFIMRGAQRWIFVIIGYHWQDDILDMIH
jgi:hypothetical protein